MSQFKKISPLWKPGIQIFRHFPERKIAHFNEKKSFKFLLSCISLEILQAVMG